MSRDPFSILFFDLETAVDHAVPFTFDESDVAIGNLKDPEKIAAKVQASRSAAAGRRALCASTARIAGVAAAAGEVHGSTLTVSSRRFVPLAVDCQGGLDDRERELLARTCGTLARASCSVGFNSRRFDIPMLWGRCAALGVSLPLDELGLSLWSLDERMRVQNHTDLLPIAETLFPQMQSHRLTAVTAALRIPHLQADPPLDKADAAAKLLDPATPPSLAAQLMDRIELQALHDLDALILLWKKICLPGS